MRTESKEGRHRVLHQSTLRSWNPPEDEESSSEGELIDEDDEVHKLDMAKVLEWFGFTNSEELSTIKEEHPEREEDVIGPLEKRRTTEDLR